MRSILACVLLGAARADEMTGAIYVSRHGVRSPYPPGGTGWPAHGHARAAARPRRTAVGRPTPTNGNAGNRKAATGMSPRVSIV